MKNEHFIMFQSLSIPETFETLATSKQGLSTEIAQERLAFYGPNILNTEVVFRLGLAIIQAIKNPFTLILIGATALSFATGHIVDAGIIILVIIANITIAVRHQKKAHRDIQIIQNHTPFFATTLRDGALKKIPQQDLVPGDIVVLEEGSRVPGDGRIIESENLTIDESPFTGESSPVYKTTKKIPHTAAVTDAVNMAWFGTNVISGYGLMVITATGHKTQFGILEKTLAHTTRGKDPFHEKIQELTSFVTKTGIIITLCLFLVRLLILQNTFIDLAMFSIALLVLIIPEGLPTVVNITLSNGARLLAQKQAIVKELSSIESIGSTSVIVTDKTGTLTEHTMKVEHCITPSNREYTLTGFGWSTAGMFMEHGSPSNHTEDSELMKMLEYAVLMNRAEITTLEDGEYEVIGEPTEASLMVVGAKGGKHKAELLQSAYTLPSRPFFNSQKKILTGIVTQNNQCILIAVGAPESITQSTEHQIPEEIQTKIASYTSQGFRTVLVAYKHTDCTTVVDEDIHSMVFAGVFAIRNPLRSDVKETIEQAHQAGIRVIMATGDHTNTAEQIGRALGIISSSFPNTIEGKDFVNLTPKEQKQILATTNVFARVTPETKQLIVDILQKNKETVTVIGDGINDTLALRRASVGVSMGKSGTDIARNASALVLANDSFKTLIIAILQGRHISTNIRRVTNFLLSTNTAQAGVFVIATFLNLPLPLIAIQILIINLVTDGIGALPFALRKPNHTLVQRVDTEHILSGFDKGMIASSALGMTIAILIAFTIGLETSLSHGQTLAFITIVATQMSRLIGFETYNKSLRTLRITHNPWLVWALVISFGITCILIAVPTLRAHLGFTLIPLHHIAIVFGLGILPLITNELYKVVYYQFSQHRKRGVVY